MKRFSFEEHLKSEYEKNVWWWPTKWYIEPCALGLYGWKEADQFFKSNYPVQYFLRNKIPRLYNGYLVMYMRDLKRKIQWSLRNPRKEMRNSVFPAHWQDLTETIIKFHVEAVIEFVEREKCFQKIDYSSDELHKKFEKELTEMYLYARTTRQELLQLVDEAYERVDYQKPYQEAYKEISDIENDIKNRDLKLSQWVIENREFFWV
jgi:hypothetical protein